MNPLLIRRRGMMAAGGGGLPYDSRVEYIEATGTQYINLGMGISLDYLAEMKAQFTQSTGVEQVLAGSRSSTRNSGVLCGMNTSNKLYTCVGDYTQRATSAASGLDLHVIQANRPSNQQIIVDGVTSSYASNSGRISYADITLFCMNWAGNMQDYASAKLYYFKLTKNNVLSIDLIPVRVGTVGYMYDQISGTLFGNLGAGDFGVGNDII